MNMRRMAALQAGFLLVAIFANAVSKSTMRIKVLDSATHSVVLDDSGVPKNCDGVNYDAYCLSSKAVQLTNTLLVQEGDGHPFRIACTIDSKFSRCTPLPIGESFDARREKHGITVYYLDDKGKLRKQLYTLVAGDAASPAHAAAVATLPAPTAHTAATVQSSAASAPVPAASVPQVVAAQEVVPDSIKCNFSSTPSGAEITVDGKYVGNTPSEIAVVSGAHVVIFSMPGFAQWKRELTVAAGSGVVNVMATLPKTLP